MNDMPRADGTVSGMSSPVAVIAGGGMLPFAVADSLMTRGITPIVFALRGICDPVQTARFRHHWISVGQIGRLSAAAVGALLPNGAQLVSAAELAASQAQ